MKITEAMSEVKLCVKKIQSNRDFVLRNLRREEWRKDPFEKDGTTQEAQVQQALQAIMDLERRIVALKNGINKTNLTQMIELEGRTMSVAEWIIWKREVLPLRKQMLSVFANQIANTAVEGMSPARRFVGQTEQGPQTNWYINVSDKWLLAELQMLETIEQRLDARLSMMNANVEVEL